jgi:preprotein translocase YajC subunit
VIGSSQHRRGGSPTVFFSRKKTLDGFFISGLVRLANPILLAQAEAAQDEGPWFLAGPWIPFALIGVMFYFLMIRPERRKRDALTGMRDNLKKNDRVVTIGGVHGVVVNAQQGSDDVTLRVDESTNTRLRVRRAAVDQVIVAEDDDE